MKRQVIFISGAISSDPNYKDKFKRKELELRSLGYRVINPTSIPEDLDYEMQMALCFASIDQADVVYFLSDYKTSLGSTREWHYAKAKNKIILYEENRTDENNIDTKGI